MTLMMIIMVKRRVMVMIEEGDHYCDGEFTEIVANGRSADVLVIIGMLRVFIMS